MIGLGVKVLVWRFRLSGSVSCSKPDWGQGGDTAPGSGSGMSLGGRRGQAKCSPRGLQGAPPPARPAPCGLAGAVRGRRGRRRRRLRGAGGGGPTAVPAGAERAGAGPEPTPWGGTACEPRRAEPRAPSGAGGWRRPRPTEWPGRAERAEPSGAERSRAAGEAAAAAKMADLEAVLADVSYLMAMEKSKATPAARASKKILLPEPR